MVARTTAMRQTWDDPIQRLYPHLPPTIQKTIIDCFNGFWVKNHCFTIRVCTLQQNQLNHVYKMVLEGERGWGSKSTNPGHSPRGGVEKECYPSSEANPQKGTGVRARPRTWIWVEGDWKKSQVRKHFI